VDKATLTDAVEHDLDAESQRTAASEERLTKIEGQLQVLSDAIVGETDKDTT
jgi:hypothetical protein